MKFLLSILLLVFFISPTLAQDSDDIKLIFKRIPESLVTKASIEKVINRLKSSSKVMASYDIIHRKVSKKISQTIYTFMDLKDEFTVTAYFFNDIVFYGRVDATYIADSTDIYISDKQFLKAKEHHSKEYNRTINNQLFIPAPNPLIGFACGAFGTPTKTTELVLNLIKTKNKPELLNWCSSLSPELRCCGLIGLSILKKENLTFSKEENDLIQKVKNEAFLVDICEGCIYFGLIKENTIKSYYKRAIKEIKAHLK